MVRTVYVKTLALYANSWQKTIHYDTFCDKFRDLVTLTRRII